MRQGLSLSTRLTIAIVALVILTAGTVGFLSYRNIEAIAVPRTLVRLDADARARAVDLGNIAGNARADLRAFRHVIGLEEIIARSRDPSIERAGPTLAQWRARLAQRMAAQLEAKPDYAQFRVIGIADGGREIIRVERGSAGGEVRVVADGELQRQGEREYFRHTMAARDGVVGVSPVELNEENGKIESPTLPVVRLSTPVFAPDGALFGMVIIDVDLRPAFKRIAGSANADTTIYVVNERGDYLTHPDASRAFGFEFGKPSRIQDDYPALAQAVVTGQWQPELIKDHNGSPIGVALASVHLADGPRISVVEAVPDEKIVGVARSALRDSSLLGGTIAVLLAILSAYILAQTLTRPLTQMTAAVAGFAEDAPLLVPLTADGEIGVLARAFKKMARETRAKSAAIRRSTEIFESIMTEMAEAVLLIEHGQIVYENRAARAMRTPTGAAAKPRQGEGFETFYADGVTPMPQSERPGVRSMRGERVDEFEMFIRRDGDDKLTHVVGSVRPIRDPKGTLTGAVVVFRDVTQTKETERQLRQSQKLDAIGQLTGGVAHDFNNMLTVITGTAEILVEGLADRPALLTVARMIDQAADRGAELTKHLLAFARMQPLEPRNVDINAMVRDTANLLRPTLGEHIEIEAVLEQDAEPARIDPSQLSTALLNLAVNARDAMPNGGKLTLETDNVVLDDAYAQANPEVQPGDYVLIAVSDTGSGIPAGLRDKVFEPFFTTKEIGKGTGLGLSMVYGFVKQSNGHIKIYSEEGHGTTIKLYLPRATANADAPAPAAPAIIGGDETIMVVEDDPLVRNFVVTQLHSLGYKTMTAASGDLALAQLDDGAVFDLLLTDVIMPGGINGRQLADTVNLRRPAVKVLYTSGYTENAIVHHGRLDVGVLLLTKPYRRSDLARMTRMALDDDPAITSGIGDAPDHTGDGALLSAPPSASRGRLAGA